MSTLVLIALQARVRELVSSCSCGIPPTCTTSDTSSHARVSEVLAKPESPTPAAVTGSARCALLLFPSSFELAAAGALLGVDPASTARTLQALSWTGDVARVDGIRWRLTADGSNPRRLADVCGRAAPSAEAPWADVASALHRSSKLHEGDGDRDSLTSWLSDTAVDAAVVRLLEHYVTELNSMADQYEGVGSPAAVARLDAEYDNVMAVVRLAQLSAPDPHLVVRNLASTQKRRAVLLRLVRWRLAMLLETRLLPQDHVVLWTALLAIARAQSDEDAALRSAVALDCLGRALAMAGRAEEAVTAAREALSTLTAVRGRHDAATLTAANNLANALDADDPEAMALYKDTLQARTATLGPRHADTGVSLNNLAVALSHAQQYVDALRMHEEAVAVLVMAVGPSHPDTAAAVGSYARTLLAAGDVVGAAAAYQERIAIMRVTHATRLKAVTHTAFAIAMQLQDKGAAVSALPFIRDALDLVRLSDAPVEEEVGVLVALATALQDAGAHAEALATYEEVVAISQSAKLPVDDVVVAMLRMAAVLKDSARFDDALAQYRQALAVAQTQGSSSTVTRSVLLSMGNLLFTMGRHRDAADAYSAANTELLKEHDSDHPDVVALAEIVDALRQNDTTRTTQ